MNKMKLLALSYGPEDQSKMIDWLQTHANSFELTQWSEHLTVPIQTAVAHFCQMPDIDGLLIDDHSHYDEIVLNQIKQKLKLFKLSLYSASNGAVPIYCGAPVKGVSIMKKLEILEPVSQRPSRLAV